MIDQDPEKPIAQQQEESLYLVRSVRVGTIGDRSSQELGVYFIKSLACRVALSVLQLTV